MFSGRSSPLARNALTQISIKEAEDLTPRLLPPRLLMSHDAVGGRQDDVTKLMRGEQGNDPLLDLVNLDVEPGGDDAALVEASVCSRPSGQPQGYTRGSKHMLN